MPITTYLSMISTSAIVAAGIFAGVQLRLYNKQRARESALQLVHSFRTPEFLSAGAGALWIGRNGVAFPDLAQRPIWSDQGSQPGRGAGDGGDGRGRYHRRDDDRRRLRLSDDAPSARRGTGVPAGAGRGSVERSRGGHCRDEGRRRCPDLSVRHGRASDHRRTSPGR